MKNAIEAAFPGLAEGRLATVTEPWRVGNDGRGSFWGSFWLEVEGSVGYPSFFADRYRL